MERNWTSVGYEFNGTAAQRARLSEYFDALEWQSIPCTMSGCGGLAIDEARKQLRLPRVDQVAESNELAPYGLLGIQCWFTNGRARVYLVDLGAVLTVLATDFYAGEKMPAGTPAMGDIQVHSEFVR